MMSSCRVSTPKGCQHDLVECLPLRLSGCLLPRTSENSTSETVWKSGIGPEWGSESGQEEWKESPFGCILSPQRRAPDALGYFPNSFGIGILRSSYPRSCIDAPPHPRITLPRHPA